MVAWTPAPQPIGSHTIGAKGAGNMGAAAERQPLIARPGALAEAAPAAGNP